MITLKGDLSESLVATLGGANKHDFTASFTDYIKGQGDLTVKGGETYTYSATTANRPVVSAPPAGVVRVIDSVTVRNTTANSTTVAFEKVSSSTDYALLTVTLASGQSVAIDREGKFTVYNATGEPKAAA